MKRIWMVAVALIGLNLAQAQEAPQVGVDPEKTSHTLEYVPPQMAPASVLSERWSIQLGEVPSPVSPVVAGGLLYYGTMEGKLLCIDPSTGSTLWSFQTGDFIFGTAAWMKGQIHVPSSDGYIYSLDAETGSLLNSIYNGSRMYGSLLAVPDVLIGGVPTDMLCVSMGSPGMELLAYDARSGDLLWAGQGGFKQISTSTPAYHAAWNRIVVGDNSGYWYCYDASTGDLKWDYWARTYSVNKNSASCMDDFVFLPMAGSKEGSRRVHILKQTDSSPFYKIFKTDPNSVPADQVGVEATPPATAADGLVQKSGGSSTGDSTVYDPTLLTDHEELSMLMSMGKADRDAHLNAKAAEYGQSFDLLKEWLDVKLGDKDGDLNKASDQTGVSYWNANLPIQTSSVTIVPAGPNGELPGFLVTHREITTTKNDGFYTTRMQFDPSNPDETKIVWGTKVTNTVVADMAHVAPSTVSAWKWVYGVRGSSLEVRDYFSGSIQAVDGGGSIDVGSGILGGPVVANGKVFITTQDGRLICYDSANHAPGVPTGMSPSQLQNITTTPILQWTAIDPDGDPVSTRLWYGIGLANPSLDLWDTMPEELAVGVSSFTLPSVQSNAKISWRVEVIDDKGAGQISPVQTFWVNRDVEIPEDATNLTTLPGNGEVSLQWQASVSSDVTGYRLQVKESSVSDWAGATEIDNLSGTQYTMTNLVNGVSYDFKLQAKDIGENYSAPGVEATETPMYPVTVNGGSSYPTIQAALNAASPGDTVVLGASTIDFIGDLVIPAGVSLRGYSPHDTRIVGSGTAPVIKVQGDITSGLVQISHLSITNGTVGIAGGSADLKIEHVVIYQIFGDGILQDDGRLEAVNNTICHNTGYGITTQTPPAETQLRNNLVGENGAGIFFEDGSLVEYNSAWGNYPDADFAPLTLGEGNGSGTSLFLDVAYGDYRVSAGSAGIDGAHPGDTYDLEPTPNGSRRNQGAYGNTYWASTTDSNSGNVNNVPTPSSGGGGGACGAMGLDFLVMLGLLQLVLRRMRRA